MTISGWFDSDGVFHAGNFDEVLLPGPPDGWPNAPEPPSVAREPLAAPQAPEPPEPSIPGAAHVLRPYGAIPPPSQVIDPGHRYIYGGLDDVSALRLLVRKLRSKVRP